MQPHDLVARLRAALQHGDDFALAGVLNPEVRLVVDAGDEGGCDLRGRARAIRVLRQRLAMHPDAVLHAVHVNGRLGLALRRSDGHVLGVLSIDAIDMIDVLWLSTAPRKLAAWNRRRPEID